jgi:hypothetical protein
MTDRRLLGWMAVALVPATGVMYAAGMIGPVRAAVEAVVMALIAFFVLVRPIGKREPLPTTPARRRARAGAFVVSIGALIVARSGGSGLWWAVGGTAIAVLLGLSVADWRDRN